MRFPPEIRHTCGNLLWLRRHAEFERRHAPGDDRALHERFLELVRWRFGRDVSKLGVESASIEQIARGIQALPQIDEVRKGRAGFSSCRDSTARRRRSFVLRA